MKAPGARGRRGIPARPGKSAGRHGSRGRDAASARRYGPSLGTGENLGPYRPLSRLEIAHAVPAGSRRARGQHEFLIRLGSDPDLVQLRADRARNIAETARVLARYASWADRTTRPTRARICKLAAIGVSTFKSARRWLEQRGYLGTVRQGRTAALRAAVLVDADTPNEAAVYVLCVPREKDRTPAAVPAQTETRPLTGSRSEPVRPPARETAGTDPRDPASVAIVARMRDQVAELSRGPGRNLTERGVLALSRPFLAARWSPGDLAHAINHDPTHGRHRHAIAGVRDPAHWLAWRLSRWTTDPEAAFTSYRRLGHWDYDAWPVPVPAPSAERAAQADRIRQAQIAARAERAATAATAVDPAPHAAAIRARLGWKTRGVTT